MHGVQHKCRVAVIGASGIGKHHAKWWAMEGAEVCAFAGRSPDSVAKTRRVLEGLFGFQGKGYTDVDEMLRAQRPDIVDVCSPNALHHVHVRAALEAGCRVMCEKPFVYARPLTIPENIALARELVELAETHGLQIGLCTQYVMAARSALRAYRRSHGHVPLTSLRGELASPARGRGPDPVPVWIDLAPHLMAAIQVLLPQGEVVWDSVETDFRDYRAAVRFEVRRPENATVSCEVVAGRTLTEPSHVRELEINGFRCVFDGTKDASGVYCSEMTSPAGTVIEPDMMRLMLRDFRAGRPATDGAFAVANLELVLRTLEHSGRC
ncbi:MAG: Gfo/Idh/MocA family oxidoreductase [Kiritimatiellaeota bacterium]|nr:Gfo/Idh/MocA family oxidoreductase [Kiritimatiellota bacterium]